MNRSIEFTHAGAGEVDVIFEAGPAGKIDHHARQRFIQRHIGVTIAANAGFVAERFAIVCPA